MCLIFEEIRNKGIEEGTILGQIAGRQQERVKNLKSLMNNCQMNLEEAMNALNISEAERDDYRKQLNH